MSRIRVLISLFAVANFSLPLVPAKAGIQERSAISSQHKGSASPLRKLARHAESPVLDPGLRRDERKGRGYDARAKHAGAIKPAAAASWAICGMVST